MTGGASTPVAAVNSFPMGMRVLVVDDDPLCLMILERMLRRCNYTVATCNMAKSALSMLRDDPHAFDLVISDVNMPDMDGFRLLELIGLEMDLPVIMMSSEGETSMVMRGIVHGACDYLLKPVRMEELKNIWQHVVRRRAAQVGKVDELSGGSFEEVECEGLVGMAVAAGLALPPGSGATLLTQGSSSPAAEGTVHLQGLAQIGQQQESRLPSSLSRSGRSNGLSTSIGTSPATSLAGSAGLAAGAISTAAGNRLANPAAFSSCSPPAPAAPAPPIAGFAPSSLPGRTHAGASDAVPALPAKRPLPDGPAAKPAGDVPLQDGHAPVPSAQLLAAQQGGLGAAERPFGAGGLNVKVSGLGAMAAGMGEWQGEEGVEFGFSSKRPRVMWSVELHQKFVAAVNLLGVDKAVPKRILEVMAVPGLTRENVASHLQKYRLCLKRLSGAQDKDKQKEAAAAGLKDASATETSPSVARSSSSKPAVKDEPEQCGEEAGRVAVKAEAVEGEAREPQSGGRAGKEGEGVALGGGVERPSAGSVETVPPANVDLCGIKGQQGRPELERRQVSAGQAPGRCDIGGIVSIAHSTDGAGQQQQQQPESSEGQDISTAALQRQFLSQPSVTERPPLLEIPTRSLSPPLTQNIVGHGSQGQVRSPLLTATEALQEQAGATLRSARQLSPSMVPSPPGSFTRGLSPVAPAAAVAAWQQRALSRSPPPMGTLSPDMGRVHRQLLALRAGIGVPGLQAASAGTATRAMQAGLGESVSARLSALLQQGQVQGQGDAGRWRALSGGGSEGPGAAGVRGLGLLGSPSALLAASSNAVQPSRVSPSPALGSPMGSLGGVGRAAGRAVAAGEVSKDALLEQALSLLVQQQQQIQQLEGSSGAGDNSIEQQMRMQQLQALIAQTQANKAAAEAAATAAVAQQQKQQLQLQLQQQLQQQLLEQRGLTTLQQQLLEGQLLSQAASAGAVSEQLLQARPASLKSRPAEGPSTSGNDDLLLQFVRQQRALSVQSAPGRAQEVQGMSAETVGERGGAGSGGGGGGSADVMARLARSVDVSPQGWRDIRAAVGGGISGSRGSDMLARQGTGTASLLSGSYEAQCSARRSGEEEEAQLAAPEGSAGSVGHVGAAAGPAKGEVGEAYSTVQGRRTPMAQQQRKDSGEGDGASNAEVTSRDTAMVAPLLSGAVANGRALVAQGRYDGPGLGSRERVSRARGPADPPTSAVAEGQWDEFLMQQLRQTGVLAQGGGWNELRAGGSEGQGSGGPVGTTPGGAKIAGLGRSLLSMPTLGILEGSEAAAMLAEVEGAGVDAVPCSDKPREAAAAGDIFKQPSSVVLLDALPSLPSCGGALLSDLLPRTYSDAFAGLMGGSLASLSDEALGDAAAAGERLSAKGAKPSSAAAPVPVSGQGGSSARAGQVGGDAVGGSFRADGSQAGMPANSLMLEGLLGRGDNEVGLEMAGMVGFRTAPAVAGVHERGKKGGTLDLSSLPVPGDLQAGSGNGAVGQQPVGEGNRQVLDTAQWGSLSADDLERLLEAVP